MEQVTVAPQVWYMSAARFDQITSSDLKKPTVAIRITTPNGRVSDLKKGHGFVKVLTLAYESTDLDCEMASLTPLTVDMVFEIAGFLQEAMQARRNVIVHCDSGMCRSATVALIAINMGFKGSLHMCAHIPQTDKKTIEEVLDSQLLTA